MSSASTGSGLRSDRGRGAALQTFHDLLAVVDHALRSRRDEDGRRTSLAADVGHRLEPLVHHQHRHDAVFRGAGVGLLQVFDRLCQTVDDGQALQGDTLALELVGVALGFGGLDAQGLLGFTLGVGGLGVALGSVDVVHRFLDLGVRIDLGDERLDDGVAEALHVFGELAVDRLGDGALGVEDLVQVLSRHERTDDVEDVGLDLRFRTRELVDRLRFLAGDDLVLHGDGHLDRDLVLGDRVDVDHVLQDLQIEDLAHRVDEGDLEVEAGAGGLGVLAEALDDLDRLVRDLEEGHAQHDDGRDDGDGGEGPVDGSGDELIHV